MSDELIIKPTDPPMQAEYGTNHPVRFVNAIDCYEALRQANNNLHKRLCDAEEKLFNLENQLNRHCGYEEY